VQRQGQEPGEQVQAGRAGREKRVRRRCFPHQKADAGAGHGRNRSARREDGVGHDQLVSRDDVWYRSAQPGQDEAVHRQHDERRCEERRAGSAVGDQRGDHHRQTSPEQVGDEQHLTTPPSVEQDTGERTDQRIRQQEDGEGLRCRRCRGVPLR
jgi:hypothetical protein